MLEYIGLIERDQDNNYLDLDGLEQSANIKKKKINDDQSDVSRRNAMTWAQRLKGVFNIDISVCAQCGSRVKMIAWWYSNQRVLRKIIAKEPGPWRTVSDITHCVPNYYVQLYDVLRAIAESVSKGSMHLIEFNCPTTR